MTDKSYYQALAELTKLGGEQYEALYTAYAHFNATLFAVEGTPLPGCIIVLTRRVGSIAGYYHHEQWEDETGGRLAEIGLHSDHLARPAMATLATLAHEMVHQQQWEYGKPSRSSYHNREWAALMDRVGLAPSDTGKPGGRRTGQRMTHYIVEGGRFEVSALALLRDGWEVEFHTMGGPKGPKAPPTRVKYVCACAQVWGKPGLRLRCEACGQRMRQV